MLAVSGAREVAGGDPERELRIGAGEHEMHITAIDDSILRVHLTRATGPSLDRTWMVAPYHPPYHPPYPPPYHPPYPPPYTPPYTPPYPHPTPTPSPTLPPSLPPTLPPTLGGAWRV